MVKNNMLLKKSSFFILLNICMGVCKELEVQQDPVINVTAGETAHLRCRFSHSGSSIIGSFRWYRGAPKGKEVNNDTHLTGIVRVDAETFSRDKDASIFILETLAQYQDTYYCEVDLLGEKSTGNGTRLIVRKPENKPNSDSENACEEDEEKRTWTVIRIILFTLLAILSIPVTYFVHRYIEGPFQSPQSITGKTCMNLTAVLNIMKILIIGLLPAEFIASYVIKAFSS
ncbi:uncharacterized protein LOC127525902 [Erpetoichthys calabaricus]|uniref:uncharacterized protein LOC127525902 n=1 Tax=Erpetoichthys calabaricus TaxID=27687 RepID=UPI0022345BC9|nr:uncharacterized protein LOC127525902 [Erpetoichthys calabaricus]